MKKPAETITTWLRASRRSLLAIGLVVACPELLWSATPVAETDSDTHPLMPGIRMRQLWDRNWPRPLHDRLATSFSPLVCNMKEAPAVWRQIEIGGTVGWTKVLKDPTGNELLLVDDGRLWLVNYAGKVLWTRGSPGTLLAQGDLRSNGKQYLLMGGGPRLELLSIETGVTEWQHEFRPSFAAVRVRVADILRDMPGQEAAVFLNYSDEGCVINFPPAGEPRIVWQREVTIPDEFNERYDHRCDIELDLSQPEEPMIWNVRRFRCRGFDARTGEMLSTLAYDIGGEHRRNYGPWTLGRDASGGLLACVIGERVQTHVHAIRLHRRGENQLVWEHYYGEVYKQAPGVTVKSLITADVDSDGTTEMVYTVRDPAADYRSFVRIRDAATGAIEFELPDHWGVASFENVGASRESGMLVFDAPHGATPGRGQLKVYHFTNGSEPELIGTLQGASLWGSATIGATANRQLLLRERIASGQEVLSRYDIVDGKLRLAARTEAAELLAAPILAVLNQTTDDEFYLVASDRGQLEARTWEGTLRWRHTLLGSSTATVAAADLDNDLKAELLVRTPSNRLITYSLDVESNLRELANYPHLVGSPYHTPVAYDLEGTGYLCVITPASDGEGNLTIRAYRSEGSLFWQSSLDLGANEVSSCIIQAGQFLADDHAGVAISVADDRLVREGTYLLDGVTGKQLWFKGRYRDAIGVFPYRPQNVATAYDFDGDGTEEIGMDLLCYMAYLRGHDGSFAYLNHTGNISTEGALYAGKLYNAFCPIFDSPTAVKPHWTVPVGFGPFGLMKPDPREGIWREDLEYDGPDNVAMIDVDGDGVMEVGYSARREKTFVCRDLWTGEVEWQLELPFVPSGLTVTADVDGDGKGEFLSGSFCIGTDEAGKGELRWQSPVPLNGAIIADVDGDGDGEIVCPRPSKIVVLDAADATP
ncbi:MAG: PQQ-binding-like beta-propeller repeat protein [Planctomycetales bacterium]|nr:PQQ-binding-like beta-propeller repeat protein [Planctomycetales bacterium]